MRVLHVSEAMGGGISSSLLAMVESTPQVDHHLLAHARASHDIGVDLDDRFSSVTVMPSNPLAAVRTLRGVARRLFPDIVHAHSSIAGALVRVAGLDRPSIVYSPHCFAFERRDVSGARRRLYTAIERSLVSRTNLFVAVAPHEIELAAALGHRRTAYVPNRTMEPSPTSVRHGAPLRIVTVGRVCAQKDWRYLIHLKRYVDSHCPVEASWQWLGGGDPAAEAELRAAGIAVSGWLDHDRTLAEMADAHVYVHTAAWEAAPISIFEAAALGLPLALRSIAPLDSLRLPGLSASIVDLASRIASLADEDRWLLAQRDSYEVVERHSREWQGQHLLDAYAQVNGAQPIVADGLVTPLRLTPLPAGDWPAHVADVRPAAAKR